MDLVFFVQLRIAARASWMPRAISAPGETRSTRRHDHAARLQLGLTPGEGLKVMFGSQAAGIVGSSRHHRRGPDPAVDALIEAALAAARREDLVAACRALDRVLRAGRYWVPMWNKASRWIAYWDLYSRPAIEPRFEPGRARHMVV
jgi:hypothetical protein